MECKDILKYIFVNGNEEQMPTNVYVFWGMEFHTVAFGDCGIVVWLSETIFALKPHLQIYFSFFVQWCLESVHLSKVIS